MKIRMGFVSNSSSSSFCIIAKDTNMATSINKWLNERRDKNRIEEGSSFLDFNQMENVIFGQHLPISEDIKKEFIDIKIDTFDELENWG